MGVNHKEIVQKVDSLLAAHPNASLQIVAERLGIAGPVIEEALRTVESVSFHEFQANKRLARAFDQMGEINPAADGPYEITRARRRLIIPKATVKYRVVSFWNRRAPFSNPCPLVDLSCDGLALLVDHAPKPKKHLTLVLKFPGGEEELSVDGRVVYAVATGITGYRYRIGIKFLPFDQQTGSNTPKTLEVLKKLEQTYSR